MSLKKYLFVDSKICILFKLKKNSIEAKKTTCLDHFQNFNLNVLNFLMFTTNIVVKRRNGYRCLFSDLYQQKYKKYSVDTIKGNLNLLLLYTHRVFIQYSHKTKLLDNVSMSKLICVYIL